MGNDFFSTKVNKIGIKAIDNFLCLNYEQLILFQITTLL